MSDSSETVFAFDGVFAFDAVAFDGFCLMFFDNLFFLIQQFFCSLSCLNF